MSRLYLLWNITHVAKKKKKVFQKKNTDTLNTKQILLDHFHK